MPRASSTVAGASALIPEGKVIPDRSLVVGILGGSSGTTLDAFHMLWEAKKYGARVALYGRKINNSEHQLTFVKYLRAVADEELGPKEAVRAYHGDLEKLGIRPYRSLADDLEQTETATSYAGSSAPRTAARASPGTDGQGTDRRSVPKHGRLVAAATSCDEPDFSTMTPAEKARWNIERWKRILG